MLAPLHPLDAYRTDAVGAVGNLIDDATQSRWLGVALLLHNAARSSGAARTAVLTEFLEHEGVHTLRGATLSMAPVMHAAWQYAIAMEEGAFLRLSHSVLASLCILIPDELNLERGRVVARRARLARLQGAMDVALGWYQEVEALGKVHELPELVGRAGLGYGSLALARGDFPKARQLYDSVLAMNDAVPSDARAIAFQGLMHCSVAAKDYDSAAQHAWAAYEGATSPMEQTSMLIDLAQLLLDAGHPAAALRGFAAVITRDPLPRSALPALGGAALAAVAECAGRDDEHARVRARSVVRTVNHRIDTLVVSLGDGAALPFESTSALVEISEALTAVGDAAAAGRAIWRARTLAIRHKFYQLAHRLDEPQRLPLLVEPTPATQVVVRHVEALKGAELVGILT
jgi:tetratricopeptide (TPR) repeat protein